ncbi:hypothetical protein PSENEW3n2_00005037 [Picochlorum sp. SENEW3]|nr:hypothetical protein PSENEW3n2_00005037 [Picochlorum sp. SENEW3]WPT17030.1 hypothetical protein PSENEW3_00005037 [Picochlorum sp. SENEW3]
MSLFGLKFSSTGVCGIVVGSRNTGVDLICSIKSQRQRKHARGRLRIEGTGQHSSSSPQRRRSTRRTAKVEGGGFNVLDKAVDAVEIVVLGGAVGVQVAYSSRKQVERAEQAPVWMTGLLMGAVLMRKISSVLSERKKRASPTSQAMLRLRKVEVGLEEHGRTMDSMMRQVDKLQTRTRLVGREVRNTAKMVEQDGALAGDVLEETSARMELLESRVEGVEELIASVHDVAAKQLHLISEVIQEQNKLKKLHIRSVDSAVNDDDKASSSQTVDEWGRRRVQRLENRDGTVSFSFDSS